MFDITVIGNGNAFGENQKYHTCYLGKTAQATFLVDCGATAVHNLENHQVDFDQLDGIIISHFHGDHYGGVPYVLLKANFLLKRSKPLTIIGPPGIEQKVNLLLDASYEGVRELLSFPINFFEYGDQSIPFHDLAVSALPVVHAPLSIPHGIRIEGDAVFAFSGDSEWTPNLTKLCKDADLFVCDCNNYNVHVNGHLSYHMILEKLEELPAKKIILTHMGADMYENAEHLILELSEQDKTYHLA